MFAVFLPGLARPDMTHCWPDSEKCTGTQTSIMNHVIMHVSTAMRGAATYHKVGNGAFTNSCIRHTEAMTEHWIDSKIKNVSMQQALSKWWHSDGDRPASEHTYEPCLYYSGPLNYSRQCEPSCWPLPQRSQWLPPPQPVEAVLQLSCLSAVAKTLAGGAGAASASLPFFMAMFAMLLQPFDWFAGV